MGKKKKKEMLLNEMNIFMRIPEDAVSVTVTAVIMKGDKPVKVSKEMNAAQIGEARRDFNEHVPFGDDYDGRFVLTEKGRALVEAMEKEKLT